jgi:hypothetical protein
MSLPEKLYLGIVLFAFASFAILLATLAWTDGRLDKPKARAAEPIGKVAHLAS